MAHELTAETVADCLRAEATRAPTLDAIEALAPPIPHDLALCAAPGLVDVAACTEVREELDRSTLLLTRLLAEAAPDCSAVWGAAFAGERLAAYLAPRLVSDATQRALAVGSVGRAGTGEELTREDARSYACRSAFFAYGWKRGLSVLEAAAGRTGLEYLGIVRELAPARLPSMRPRVASTSRHECSCTVSIVPWSGTST